MRPSGLNQVSQPVQLIHGPAQNPVSNLAFSAQPATQVCKQKVTGRGCVKLQPRPELGEIPCAQKETCEVLASYARVDQMRSRQAKHDNARARPFAKEPLERVIPIEKTGLFHEVTVHLKAIATSRLE